MTMLFSLRRIAISSAALLLLSTTVLASDETKAVELFNGKNFEGWRALFPNNNAWVVGSDVKLDAKDNKKFEILDGQGVMVNGPRGSTSNLLSDYEHGDCVLHIEFCVPQGSNSGVYFQGLYEVQVFDSFGKDKVESSDCGGIYARFKDNKTYEGHPPRVNASKAPGEWQSFDVTFRAPRFDDKGEKTENAKFVKVMHNGQVVHENVEVTGDTRASLLEFGKVDKESPKGPLMLQGDHGPVAYRNIQLKPVTLE